MSSIKFQSLTGEPLIELADANFELAIETPDGLKNIKLESLMEFINAALNQRVTDVETSLDSLGLDPENPRTLTVNGDVEGSASLMSNNIVLTLNVPDGALSTSAVSGLAANLLGLRLDVDDAILALANKLEVDAPAIAAHRLVTPRMINGVLFDGTEDITVGLSPEQEAQLGDDKHYTHTQSTASDSWLVNHNLNKYPSANVVDSAGTNVVGAIEYVDLNSLRLKFAGAMSGKAFIN